MRTSKGNSQGNAAKLAKRALKVALALVFFAFCNMALTFALEPYGSKSQVIWDDYTKQDRIDTLFVGSSFAHQGFDPAAFDAVSGGRSFNLASPNQSIEDSYVAVRTAYDDFGISRVVLGVSYSELYRSEPSNPQSTFLRERARATGETAAAQTMLAELFSGNTLSSSVSINGFFPWINSHVDPSVSAIAENVKARASGMPLVEAAALQDPTWKHVGQGFGAYDHVFDRNTELGFYFNEAEASGEVGGMDPNRARTLRALCDFCASHDIELVAVVVPLPAHNIEYYGRGYFAEGALIRDFLAQWGVPYYDMNLARPALLQIQDEDYYDYAHLNGQGAQKCSAALASVLQKTHARTTDAAAGSAAGAGGSNDAAAAGNGTGAADGSNGADALWYSEGEFWASLTTVSAVLAGATATPDGLTVTCEGFAGPAMSVEYQVCMKDAAGNWNVVRDYAPEPTCFIDHPERGAVELRVNARCAQSSAAYESYREFTAFY